MGSALCDFVVIVRHELNRKMSYTHNLICGIQVDRLSITLQHITFYNIHSWQFRTAFSMTGKYVYISCV